MFVKSCGATDRDGEADETEEGYGQFIVSGDDEIFTAHLSRRDESSAEEIMIDITFGTPENLIIAVGHGKVTGDDYEKVLIPAIEAALKTHKRIRLLYQLDEDFLGVTARAIWDDAKLGLGHPATFEAIAVVTDVHWVINATGFFGFFMPCPVKVFSNDKLAEAKEWVTHTTGWLAEA